MPNSVVLYAWRLPSIVSVRSFFETSIVEYFVNWDVVKLAFSRSRVLPIPPLAASKIVEIMSRLLLFFNHISLDAVR